MASRLNLNLFADALACTTPHIANELLVLVLDDFLHSSLVDLVFCYV